MIRIMTMLALIAGFAIAPAFAAERLALVIGNSAYREMGSLDNPRADAELMAGALAEQGFETQLLIDADAASMKESVAKLGRRLRTLGSDAVGLFYYAGHGVQANGRNYLIPVEASPMDVADLDLMAVEVDWVMRMLEFAANQTNVIILDACRNNPFASGSRSGDRGLARLNAPTGSFVAYATAPGGVADDGDGVNSPFTQALAAALHEPGKTIEQVFKQVRIDVMESTEGKQVPWDSSSLVRDFYFTAPPAPGGPKPVEISLWNAVSKSGDAGRIALFLQVYPESVFAPDARSLLAETMAADPSSMLGADAGGAMTGAATKAEGIEVAARAATPTVKPVEKTSEKPTLVDEAAAFEKARLAGDAVAYRDFLAAFPDGVFAALANAELDALGAASTPGPAPAQDPGPISFTALLEAEDAAIAGRSLETLTTSTPHYPPVEGLPESYWKTQECSYCHNWSRQALCDQGDFYNRNAAETPTRIRHPYGGAFKTKLAEWAAGGCN
ncbi:caspase family protein [Pikeienuella piscinae]|uniref:Caspase family protein n=1 Tax=Pikeienuella piscinae TaxID=2748098 RepID=A0A7L5BSU4_9RHOB|nr:caspase family protein [Pikeienuella piscinae]QIE54405.1 caspase family protein [Pikeienuella piscinae]